MELYDIVAVTIILALVAAMLGGHLVVAAIVWRHFSLRGALSLSVGLSILSTLVWNYGGILVCLFTVGETGNRSSTADQACRWTLDLTHNICNMFPQLWSYGIDFCAIVLPFLVAIPFFFLLSLLPASLVQRKSDVER